MGGKPLPTRAPALVGWELVTNGYVPKSRSSSALCAPSRRTRSPRARASHRTGSVDRTRGASRPPTSDRRAPSSSIGGRFVRCDLLAYIISRRSRRTAGRSRSAIRMPQRAARSAYAGPIPRRVVPEALPGSRRARRSSCQASSISCTGSSACARSEIITSPSSSPRRSSSRISSSRANGWSTMPGPHTPTTPLRRTPHDSWWRTTRPSGRWNRVPGVRTPAGADHVACVGRKVIEDLALPFVAKLRADLHADGRGSPSRAGWERSG